MVLTKRSAASGDENVTNRRLGSTAHASLMHAYDTWNLQKLSSCKATSSDAMISRAMKSRTNEHTVRGRPTLKVVKTFSKRVGLQGLREINNLRANALSEFIMNHVMLCYAKELAINRGYRLFTLIKSI